MPRVGEEDFPYTDEGIEEAQEASKETGLPVEGMDNNIKTSDASQRKTNYGVQGAPGDMNFGVNPSTPRMYEEGGKVEKYDMGGWVEGSSRSGSTTISPGYLAHPDKLKKLAKELKKESRKYKREEVKKARSTKKGKEKRKAIKKARTDHKGLKKETKRLIKKSKGQWKEGHPGFKHGWVYEKEDSPKKK